MQRVGALGSVLLVQAQEATPEYNPLGDGDLPLLIRVQAEFIELPHETMTGLLAEPRKGGNDTDLRKRVGELVAAGKGRVVETMICVARSGQKSTSESLQEYTYPAEYDPPVSPPAKDGVPLGGFPVTPGIPTAFETRNVGFTFEIEPTLGLTDHIIDLRLNPEIIYHVRNEVWAEWKVEHGNALVQLPIFYSLKLNTAVTLVAGQPLMIGALSPRNEQGVPDENRKLMVFVRAEVLTIGR